MEGDRNYHRKSVSCIYQFLFESKCNKIQLQDFPDVYKYVKNELVKN